jgi:hypothetical protein
MSPCLVPLRHWPKFYPSAQFGPDCPLNHQQKPLTCEPTICMATLELMLSSGKLNGPVWYSRLSSFFAQNPSCTAAGQHSHNGCLLRGSLCDQNLQLVLTIPSESASAVEPRSLPPCPRWTWWIHHRRRSPWLMHWWPDQKVRCWMILPLTTIPAF